MRKVLACIFLFAAPLLAQSHFEGGAAVGATGPSFEASAGFVYLSMDMPSEHVALTGLDATGLIRFAERWGVTADATYASTGNVLSTGHSGNFLGVLAGPVFYPVSFRRAAIFVHVLVGVGRVDSAVPVTETKYLGGWVTRPSYAVGAGIEQSLFGPFAVRLQADYQRTTFVNSTDSMQGQNNLRLTSSIVYRFGGSAERR